MGNHISKAKTRNFETRQDLYDFRDQPLRHTLEQLWGTATYINLANAYCRASDGGSLTDYLSYLNTLHPREKLGRAYSLLSTPPMTAARGNRQPLAFGLLQAKVTETIGLEPSCMWPTLTRDQWWLAMVGCHGYYAHIKPNMRILRSGIVGSHTYDGPTRRNLVIITWLKYSTNYQLPNPAKNKSINNQISKFFHKLELYHIAKAYEALLQGLGTPLKYIEQEYQARLSSVGYSLTPVEKFNLLVDHYSQVILETPDGIVDQYQRLLEVADYPLDLEAAISRHQARQRDLL